MEFITDSLNLTNLMKLFSLVEGEPIWSGVLGALVLFGAFRAVKMAPAFVGAIVGSGIRGVRGSINSAVAAARRVSSIQRVMPKTASEIDRWKPRKGDVFIIENFKDSKGIVGDVKVEVTKTHRNSGDPYVRVLVTKGGEITQLDYTLANYRNKLKMATLFST